MNTFGLHHQLLLAFNHTNRTIVRAMADSGLLPGQPKILEALSFQDGCTQKELARYCALDKSTITHLLKRLESQGLIIRKNDETDRRMMRIFLSNDGRRAAAMVCDVAQNIDKSLADLLSETDHQILTAALQHIIDMVYDEEDVD